MKRTVSRVLPEAPLKTRVGLGLLGIFFLFISIFGAYWFLEMSMIYDSYSGVVKFATYQVVIDSFLIIGSVYLLLGKKLGWCIITSFLVLRILPRFDRIMSLPYKTDDLDLIESLFGYGLTATLIVTLVLILLLVFMYSQEVRLVYRINKMTKLVPIVAALLFGSLWVVMSNFF